MYVIICDVCNTQIIGETHHSCHCVASHIIYLHTARSVFATVYCIRVVCSHLLIHACVYFDVISEVSDSAWVLPPCARWAQTTSCPRQCCTDSRLRNAFRLIETNRAKHQKARAALDILN